MNAMMKKLTAGLLLFAMLAAPLPGQLLKSFAADGKITFSDPSVTVGNQVSVTMKITSSTGEGLGASDVMLGYDSSALEFISGTNANGGAGSVRILGTMEAEGQKTFSFTLKFKALQAGKTNISVKSQEVYDSNSQAVNITHVGSSAVTVNAPASFSKEASLSSLQISPGELSPAFSPDVTSYTASVSGDVSKVTVSAPAKDSKAKVVITGNDGLQIGENTVVCKVTAEDGETVKSYTITVTKSETAETTAAGESEAVDANAQGSGMNLELNKMNYQVAATFDAAALPEGFTSSECSYHEALVQCGYSDEKNIRLLYLTDESGNGDFFIYNELQDTFAPYVVIDTAEKAVLVLPRTELPADTVLPDGFVATQIDTGEASIDGWIWNTGDSSEPEYCVVYGINENGDRNFYRYDQKEMTLQRYFQDPAAESIKEKYVAVAEDYNELLGDYGVRGWIIAGLFAVCIILVIVILVLLLVGRKPKSPRDMDYYLAPEPDIERRPARSSSRVSERSSERASDRVSDRSSDRVSERAPKAKKGRSWEDDYGSAEEMEQDIARNLAREADSHVSEKKKDDDDDDDFEFIDLDL